MFRRISRKSWLFTFLSGGIALAFVGMTATAQAQDTDGYAKTNQVNVGVNPITCNVANNTIHHTTGFSFDISWIEQDRGEYLLADRSHGFATTNNERGMITNPNSGDLLVIDTNNPAAGPSVILPPKNDPFAGLRCDANDQFGGLDAQGANAGRNEITGPNGVFTVNTTQAWAGDGPSHFAPDQNNLATDYSRDPCDSSVRVFDLVAKQQIAHINVHGCFRTDEGAFDPVDQIALFANPSENAAVAAVAPAATAVATSPFLTLISTVGSPVPADQAVDQTNFNSAVSQMRFSILTQINFDGTNGTVHATGGIEQAVYSRQTGLFYIAIPDNTGTGDGYVAVVDPRTGANFGQVTSLPLAHGTCPGGPAGAALGPNHELLLGCGGASAAGGEVVVDITPANIVHSVEVAPLVLADGSQSCDEVAYDAGSGHFGGACFTSPPGTFRVLINDAKTAPPAFDLIVPNSGASGAHSIAADNINAQFWVPKFQGDCGVGVPCVAVYSGNDSDAMGP